MTAALGFLAVGAALFAVAAIFWRQYCLRAQKALTEATSSLTVAREEIVRLESKIKEYGADRVRRGDELADMGGKVAWITHFLQHITNPPKLYSIMTGSRWQLVPTHTISLIREVLGEIAGDWDAFETALVKEAERRRIESGTKTKTPRVGRRPKRSSGGARGRAST